MANNPIISSEKDIQAIRWVGKDQRIRIDHGLYLNIRPFSKTFLVRKMINGKAQVITLGKSPTLSLREARLRAAEYLIAKDVSNTTTQELTSKYFEEIVEPKSKVPKQVLGYLNHIDDEIGNRKVIDITTVICVSFIQKYSRTRGERSADRLRSYLLQVFGYGVELGWVKNSPMAGVTKRITGYHPIERKRIITPDEIRMIWSWRNPESGWQKTEDNVRVLKFLLLSGLRISEAQQGYVDGDKFRIDDTKGKHAKHEKRPHWVFLTDSVRELLPLPECTATNIQAWLKRRLISKGYNDNRFTPHDCRRTFATLANSNGIDPFIVERALNHRMQGVMSIYNHAEYEAERIECAKTVEAAILSILK
ncbi:MAG: integrase family protein [Candidatus Thiodiazotropha sp.]|nr:integrase family protein [Candidatus Thiodiazotropha sp.]MCM8885457.1 integrase family protein [Candidatus Thiodiazotropha sp.]MCM8920709.1 integrase family protein [Candidatus Thiodiazotropha sp.]